MSAHPQLTLTVYILAATVFALVILYCVLYTRKLKTPRHSGTQAAIAVATERKERAGTTGMID
jgi:H+/Cl- antiporter ClcA